MLCCVKEHEFQERKNPNDEDYVPNPPDDQKEFIPLQYKGKLNIIHQPGRVFNSVEEMIQYFPRFVSVVQEVIDTWYSS